MDFELSPDQVALRDAAADLLDALAAPERVRSALEADGGYDGELWTAMAQQGWMAVERGESVGGLGLGLVEVAVLCEQVGQHAAPVPFLPSVLALGALDRADAGGVPGLAGWISSLSAGESVGCVAWSARDGAVSARWKDDRWVLEGTPDPVEAGPDAAVAVVVAVQEGREPGLFAVDLGAGLQPRVEPAMDRTRSLGWLELQDAPALRLGGPEAVTALFDRASATVSCLLLGGADRVLSMTVEYAKERVQFGRPIGSFQAVKHRCADMLVDVEGMRSTAYNAAWTVGAARPDASIAASTAKAWGSEASRRVMASGLQVHGGIGFTWEHDLHIFLKRAQLDRQSFGDAAFHRERLARLLRERVLAGEPVL